MIRPQTALPLIAAFFAAFWATFPPEIAFIQPDSGSYIQGSQIRGFLYPFFLDSVPLENVAIIQLLIYFAAAALASVAIATSLSSTVAGLAFLVFVGANRELVKFCFTILSEGFTLALAMSLVTATAYAVRAKISGFVAMGLVCACAVDFRPVNWSWVPLIPIAALMVRASWRVLAAGMLAFALPMVMLAAWQSSEFTATKRDFLAANLFGKFALLIVEPRDAFEAAIAARTAPMRAHIEAQAEFEAAWRWRTRYAESLRYSVWENFADTAPTDPGERLDRVLDIALTRPGAYLEELGRQLLAFWTMPDLMSADERATLIAQGEPAELLPIARHNVVVYVARVVLAIGFAVSVALLLAAMALPFVRAAPGWSLACLGALALWGNWVLIGLVHTALPRYAFVGWPYLGLCLAAAIAGIDHVLGILLRPMRSAKRT